VPLQARASTKGRWQLATIAGGGILEVLEAGASEQTADKKGRGGTTHRLHCTEIAFWEVAAATMDSVLNSVTAPAPATEVTIETTPSGVSTSENDPRGGPYFHRLWKRATSPEGDEFTPHFFPWFELPGRRLTLEEGETCTPDQQSIEARRVREEQCWTLLNEKFADEPDRVRVVQEYLKWFRAQVRAKTLMRVDKELPTDPITCFIASGECYLDKDITEHLIAEATRKEKAWNDVKRPYKSLRMVRGGAQYGLRIFEDVNPKQLYIVVGDTSGGEGGDPAALQVWTRVTKAGEQPRHVATLHGQVKPKELGRLAVALALRFNQAIIALERNNMGCSAIDELVRPDMLSGVLLDEAGALAATKVGFPISAAPHDLRMIAGVLPSKDLGPA